MVLLTTPATPGRAAKHHGGLSLLSSVNSLWNRVTKKLGNGGSSNSPKSPLAKPKKLLATINGKGNSTRRKKKAADDEVLDADDFGHGGLWQRSILMGDKCQPLDFSGVIYYDSTGNRMTELPIRSPRASPLPSYLKKP